ncbi:MAG: precorrin-3B C(17)-methyltransferase [Pseudomonadota bacterium]
MRENPALVSLTPGGLETARRVAAGLPGAEMHGRDPAAEVRFAAVAGHLQGLFRDGRPIVAFCATGIVVRILGPLLDDKGAEPPVVVVAEDGGAVVPLLGGHRGANALAERIGKILGVAPAITTASDRRFGVALDAPPHGWRLANPEDHKAFAAALLSGSSVRLEGTAPWLTESDLPWAEDGELAIKITERAETGSARELVYHPATLALGVGCERGCEAEELDALVHETLATQGLAPGALAGVYSLDLKADENAVQALAAGLEVPARFFDAATLEAEAPRLATPSEAVFREVGCHGVAEGAALAAAGPAGRLIVAKTKSRRATCAVAIAPQPIGPAGRPRGSLAVVGIGPGDRAWRTPEAEAAVAGASDLVGYGLYLDLLGSQAEGKARHAYQLGEEEARARIALELAAEGRAVALVCSGDPGIYAMAALVFELLERGGQPAWMRPAITVVPGISALQAAAARIGAPLGHDFCAISLSDLLTPWAAIERRLKAAAEGDFVVAIYNPVSKKRDHQLARAAEILSAHRPGDTPVVLARNLGRSGESLRVIDLVDLTPDQADMLTLVLIGSSATRRVARPAGGCWVYTPRGYAAKATTGTSDPEAAA